jgi:hypothetical protein
MQHDGVGKNCLRSRHGIAQVAPLLRSVQGAGHHGQGLGELFRNSEASVCITKWAAELSEYHITFEPRTTIKSQVLADFIVDWIGPAIHVQLCVPGQPDPSTHWPDPTMACPGTTRILSRAGPGWPVDWRRSPDPARQLLHGPGRALSTVSPSVRVGPVPSQKTTELV